MGAGRVVIYDQQIWLDLDGTPALGDRFVVVRGNGPREGERMGVAIVIGFDDDGAPQLDVQLGEALCRHAETFPPNDDGEIVCKACWEVVR